MMSPNPYISRQGTKFARRQTMVSPKEFLFARRQGYFRTPGGLTFVSYCRILIFTVQGKLSLITVTGDLTVVSSLIAHSGIVIFD